MSVIAENDSKRTWNGKSFETGKYTLYSLFNSWTSASIPASHPLQSSINSNPNPLTLNPKRCIKEIMIHLHIPIARLEKAKVKAAAPEDGCEREVEFAVG